MKLLLLWLAALPFAADVERLGDRDYPTRRDATQRLRDAGWLAYAAISAAAESPSPERADRATTILERLRAPWDSAAAALIAADCDGFADEQLLPLRLPLCRRLDLLSPLAVTSPQSGSRLPVAGELRMLVEAARERRRFAATLPPP